MRSIPHNFLSNARLDEDDDGAPTDTSRCLSRRLALGALGATLLGTVPATADTKGFEFYLNELKSNPDLVQAAWVYRDHSVAQGVPTGTPSKRKLNQTASDFIITCEVSSPAIYQARYMHPVWPGGSSGLTIGVGYDLGFSNEKWMKRDWPNMSDADRALLRNALHVYGLPAKAKLQTVASVKVPWDEAKAQFFAFLPYPTKKTEDAFPNCSDLSDDSFGALVSLIFNRGDSIPEKDPSRHEMYLIQQFMASKQFDKVPDQFRAMKHLWPDSRGLQIRRDAEAALFEHGLTKT